MCDIICGFCEFAFSLFDEGADEDVFSVDNIGVKIKYLLMTLVTLSLLVGAIAFYFLSV